MAITADFDGLAISQWQGSPNLQFVADCFVRAAREALEDPQDALRSQGLLDEAEGVWLDYLGFRLGVERPYTSIGGDDPRWGFDAAGEPFNQAPFQGDAVNDATFPLPDVIFRRFLKSRAILLLGQGTFGDLEAGLAEIDPDAIVTDNLNMSVTIAVAPANQWRIELADRVGALPRPCGVSIIFVLPPAIPDNALTWRGEPLRWRGEILTWR